MGQQYNEIKCQSATAIFGLGAEWMPSRLSPLAVAAVSAAASAAADDGDDDGGGGGGGGDDAFLGHTHL